MRDFANVPGILPNPYGRRERDEEERNQKAKKYGLGPPETFTNPDDWKNYRDTRLPQLEMQENMSNALKEAKDMAGGLRSKNLPPDTFDAALSANLKVVADKYGIPADQFRGNYIKVDQMERQQQALDQQIQAQPQPTPVQQQAPVDNMERLRNFVGRTERQQQQNIADAQIAQQTAATSTADLVRAQNEAQQVALDRQKVVLQTQQTERQELAKKQQVLIDAQKSKIQGRMAQLDQFEPEGISAGQGFAMAAGAALIAFGQIISGTGNGSSALSAINQVVKNQIAKDQLEYNRRKEGVMLENNIYATMKKDFGDERTTLAMSHAAGLEMAMKEIKKQGLEQIKDPQAKAELDGLLSRMANQSAQLQNQAISSSVNNQMQLEELKLKRDSLRTSQQQKNVPAGIMQELAGIDSSLKELTDLENNFFQSTGPGSIGLQFKPGSDADQYNSLRDVAVANYVKTMTGKAATEGERAAYSKMFPAASTFDERGKGKFFALKKSLIDKRDALRNQIYNPGSIYQPAGPSTIRRY